MSIWNLDGSSLPEASGLGFSKLLRERAAVALLVFLSELVGEFAASDVLIAGMIIRGEAVAFEVA